MNNIKLSSYRSKSFATIFLNYLCKITFAFLYYQSISCNLIIFFLMNDLYLHLADLFPFFNFEFNFFLQFITFSSLKIYCIFYSYCLEQLNFVELCGKYEREIVHIIIYNIIEVWYCKKKKYLFLMVNLLLSLTFK